MRDQDGNRYKFVIGGNNRLFKTTGHWRNPCYIDVIDGFPPSDFPPLAAL